VNAVTAAGVLYFSSAGNGGALDQSTSGTWEGTFNAAGGITSALIPNHTLHEFAPGITQNVAASAALRAFLHWAEPSGAAAVDYDLYVLDAAGATLIGASTNTQNGTQDPYEVVALSSPLPANARVVVAKKTGAPDRMLALQWYRGRLTNATGGATRGHSSAVNAFSVAATPASAAFGASPPWPAGPYPMPFGSTGTVELFSSDGPRRMFFDSAGGLLPGAPAGDFTASGGVVRNKPDITAADGVATSTPGFAAFYGTSAAAPHAAASAALIRQAFPGWTQAQFRSAVAASAIDIHGPGWDRNSGAGIMMPLTRCRRAGRRRSRASSSSRRHRPRSTATATGRSTPARTGSSTSSSATAAGSPRPAWSPR
jgi:subtilisin family serine protease